MITLNEPFGSACAWERRAAEMNVLDGDELPLLALAGSEVPKLRITAASAALRSVAPARRPPLPQRALPRESPPRVLPQRALALLPCRSSFKVISPFFRVNA